MAVYILRRLAISLPLLLIITLGVYVMINATPGDPVTMLVDPNQMNLSEDVVAAHKKALGLDKPLPIRYLVWLREAITGNLGYSFVTKKPVATTLANRLAATGQLVAAALTLVLLFAIPLGILAAVLQRSWVDYLTNALGLFAVSVPSFFLALGMIYIFSLKLKLLPTAGMSTLGTENNLLDHLKHLVMPAVVLSLLTGADIMRYTRAGILDVLSVDYIRTARAKGVTEPNVLVRHALRTALLPLITVIGLRIPQLLGGAVITETIFQWPGMGLLSIQAIQSRDYPVLMGVLIVSAVVVVFANLISDVVYGWADPRIRLGDTSSG